LKTQWFTGFYFGSSRKSQTLILLNGIQEVSGSIPLISTIGKSQKALKLNGFRAFCFFDLNLWRNAE